MTHYWESIPGSARQRLLSTTYLAHAWYLLNLPGLYFISYGLFDVLVKLTRTRKPKLNKIYFGELGENTYNSAVCTTYGLQIDTSFTLFGRGFQKLGQILIPTL